MFTHYFMRSRVWLSLVSCFVLVMVGLSACSQGQNSAPTFTNQTPITIGISLPLDKDFASDGQAMQQGYLLWQSMVNNSGGILGRPVKFIILNDHSDPGQTAKDYTTLITQDHVNLIFGPFSTLLTKAAAPVAEKLGYAQIEGAGGGPSVFQNGWHNTFDVSLPVANNLVTFAYYVLSLPPSLRPKTAAYATSDDPFTQPQLVVAKNLLENAGVRTVFDNTSNPYPESDPNYVQKYIPSVAQRVVNSGAQIDILGTLLPDLQAYVKTFKKDHYNPKAMIATAGPDAGNDFIAAVGGIKYTEGVFVPNGWYPQANNFQNAEMVQAYLNKYGGTEDQINADVAEAYSVGQVAQQAIESVGSLDNSKIIAKLHSLTVFNSVQGTVQFDTSGSNKQGLAFLFQWQTGQFIPVYPLSVASQNPEYPKTLNY